jgi:light-independent protochlorophyllide reductase subunit B
MQLAVWTYEGPPHVGAMRVATAMRGVHLVLHAPQGDTYADLLFTMIERRGARPPVTYTTFQARDLGSDTAELFKNAARQAHERFRPEAMLVGASCTAELIQDDPGGLAEALRLPCPVIPLELPSYQRKEHWGAAETFFRIVQALCSKILPGTGRGTASRSGVVEGAHVSDAPPGREVGPLHQPSAGPPPRSGEELRPSANILGPCALGFRHRDDVVEVTKLLHAMSIDVNVVAPLGASPADIARLGEADFNILLYPEIGGEAARWLERTYGQKTVRTVPIGAGATRDFIAEVAAVAGVAPTIDESALRLPWWSRSVDSTYLTGKRVFIFGDATHAIAAARVARDELGFEVVGLGCYNREFARELRAAAAEHGVEPLVTDDHLAVEEAITALQPELVLGTQMERHIAKRLGIACAVISAPVHVQDFPARHSPIMGFEGANGLFDAWVHPLTMGLEEHLLAMFRDDPEFHDAAGASHLRSSSPERGGGARQHDGGVSALEERSETVIPLHHSPSASGPPPLAGEDLWTPQAEAELRKIPFFVRDKARRNTEAFAAAEGRARIDLVTLYDAKAHYGR